MWCEHQILKFFRMIHDAPVECIFSIIYDTSTCTGNLISNCHWLQPKLFEAALTGVKARLTEKDGKFREAWLLTEWVKFIDDDDDLFLCWLVGVGECRGVLDLAQKCPPGTRYTLQPSGQCYLLWLLFVVYYYRAQVPAVNYSVVVCFTQAKAYEFFSVCSIIKIVLFNIIQYTT